MKYRQEIDGLRAVALIPVILFHAGVPYMAGGFVGVDVFFVMSGYLITTLIVSEAEAGLFTLARFYERRARRILPALFLTIGCCVPCAYVWMTPAQLDAFARSVVASVLFSSNMEFWKETGYFGIASESKPLLHTWSLAVEEQYYILFPLFVLALRRLAPGIRVLAVSIACIAIISLALAEYASRHYSVANFFFLPTRAWELMIGALCALMPLHDFHAPRAMKEGLAALGLFLILYAMVAFGPATPVPGLAGLIPTTGAALVILFAMDESVVNRLLSTKLLVKLGLISYSAYLFHQPLLAFARVSAIEARPVWLMAGIGLLSFPLAWLSWRFVETPFRQKTRVPQRAFLTTTLPAGAALCAAGLALALHIGLSARDARYAAISARLAVNYGLGSDCDYEGPFQTKPVCQTGPHPTIAVWGDSFAMHLVTGVRAANPARGIVQLTRSVCGPVLGLAPVSARYPIPWARSCLAYNNDVFDYLKARPEITEIVLSSILVQYVSGDFKFLTETGERNSDSAFATTAFLRTIRALEAIGKRVTVISPTAKYGPDIGQCLFQASTRGLPLKNCDFPARAASADAAPADALLHVLQTAGVHIVWLPRYTCGPSVCAASEDGMFLYRDTGHLTQEGAAWFGTHVPELRLSSLSLQSPMR